MIIPAQSVPIGKVRITLQGMTIVAECIMDGPTWYSAFESPQVRQWIDPSGIAGMPQYNSLASAATNFHRIQAQIDEIVAVLEGWNEGLVDGKIVPAFE